MTGPLRLPEPPLPPDGLPPPLAANATGTRSRATARKAAANITGRMRVVTYVPPRGLCGVVQEPFALGSSRLARHATPLRVNSTYIVTSPSDAPANLPGGRRRGSLPRLGRA